MVKNPPAKAGHVRDTGSTLVWKDALEKRIATHSGIIGIIGVLKARILKWFAIPFSSRPHSVRPLHYDPPILGGLMGMA